MTQDPTARSRGRCAGAVRGRCRDRSAGHARSPWSPDRPAAVADHGAPGVRAAAAPRRSPDRAPAAASHVRRTVRVRAAGGYAGVPGGRSAARARGRGRGARDARDPSPDQRLDVLVRRGLPAVPASPTGPRASRKTTTFAGTGRRAGSAAAPRADRGPAEPRVRGMRPTGAREEAPARRAWTGAGSALHGAAGDAADEVPLQAEEDDERQRHRDERRGHQEVPARHRASWTRLATSDGQRQVLPRSTRRGRSGRPAGRSRRTGTGRSTSEAIAGTLIGRASRKNAVAGLAPSIAADSKTSRGRPPM